ncbi:MAG: type I polyketide synthase, partial [Planctomycetota bacterium]
MSDLERRLAQMSPLQRAVLALKETQQRLETLERQREESIAIVGMACRFPGGANDPNSYWKLLTQGVDAIREIPAERWDVDAYYDPDPTAPGKMNTRWGGFLDNIELFDNHFFSISDREATRLDPLHRMSLELTWEALEDAGLPPTSLRGSRTGVFIGLSHSEYGMKLSADPAQSDAYVSTGTAHCLAANRVSFLYDFHGPSVTLDTACSSSLVAVHMACQSLRLGESEMAIAGGVNIILSPMATVNLTKAGFSAVDGRVRAFSAGATGYVRSEGAGLLVLKPLSAARRQGDAIYAVIRGSAINQNGFSNGLTAPSRVAQELVLRQAYATARVTPAQVQYVEAQGTGTHLGDAIEARALGEVLAEGRSTGQRCSIGSVKTNIGHLEAASGAASLMKVALALHHGQVPPTLHFTKPNPDIPFETLPLQVQTSLEPWPGESPRIAGVSGFGFGGSNAHLVVGDAPEPTNPPTNTAPPTAQCRQANAEGCLNECPPRWLTLSARTERALRAVAENYRTLLKQPQGASWADICHSAAVHRDHHDCRLAIRASHTANAADLLSLFLEGRAAEQPDRIQVGRKPGTGEAKIAFLFGPASAPSTMNRQPGATSARLDAELTPRALAGHSWQVAVQEVDAVLARLTSWTLSAALADQTFWNNSPHRPAAALAYQIAVAAWFRSLSVNPAVNLGVGVGELAAAVSSGILSLEDALRIALASAEPTAAATAAITNITIQTARIPCVSADDSVNLASLTTADAWLQRLARFASPNWQVVTSTIQRREVVATVAIEATESLRGIGQQSSLSLLGTHQPTSNLPHEEALGTLYRQGVNIRWQQLANGDERYVRLPLYPWQRQRLWVDAVAHTPTAVPTTPPVAVRAVEEPHRPRPELNTSYEAPSTPLESALAKSWAQILKLEQVGVRDNFFELGGDSLQGTILLNQLQEQLGEVVHVLVLFQFQTIHDLARHLRESYRTAVARLFPDEPFADETAEQVRASSHITERDVEFSQRMTDSLAPNRVLAPVTGAKNRRAV